MMQANALAGAFTDPPRQSAHAFRAAMRAMARPGSIEATSGAAPPAPLSPAAGALALVLFGPDTPLHLAGAHNTQALRDWLTFHCACPFSGPAEAAFAIGTFQALGAFTAYPQGTPEYPDRSATLIVELEALRTEGTRLKGPGIRTEASFGLPDPDSFRTNAAQYPLGLDFFFTAGAALAALPRSTQVL